MKIRSLKMEEKNKLCIRTRSLQGSMSEFLSAKELAGTGLSNPGVYGDSGSRRVLRLHGSAKCLPRHPAVGPVG